MNRNSEERQIKSNSVKIPMEKPEMELLCDFACVLVTHCPLNP